MKTAQNYSFPSSLRTRSGWADYLASGRSADPHVHQIEPTNACIYSCIMCPRPEKMTRPVGFMDMGLYRKVIDEIATFAEPARSKEIELFHFGESLLHPGLGDMVRYASDQGLMPVLSVNAPQLTPAKAESILAGRPHRLIISLDGHDQESYRNIRGAVADFDLAVANIASLMPMAERMGAMDRIVIRMIKLRENGAQAEAFLRDWERRGISVELRPFFPWTERNLSDLGDYQKYPPGMPCPFPWQYLVVQWDGTVVPCCRDYNAINAVGNMRDASLRELWNSAGYSRFREQHRTGRYGANTFCSQCMELFYTPGEDESESGYTYSFMPDAPEQLVPALAPCCEADLQRGIVLTSSSPYGGSDGVSAHRLSPNEARMIMLAGQGFPLRDIAGLLGLQIAQVLEDISPLVTTGIVRLVRPPEGGTGRLVMRARTETIPSLWRDACSAHGDRPLLILSEDGSILTYEEVAMLVSRIAGALSSSGVVKGDRVAVCAPLRPEALLLFWASAEIGAVYVPLDPFLSGPVLKHIIAEVQPRLLFCGRDHLPEPEDREGVPSFILDEPEAGDVESVQFFSDLMAAAEVMGHDKTSAASGDPAVILYTSGTSGVPKGVVLSHGALYRSGRLMASAYGWTGHDILFSLAELHTMSGLRNPAVAALHGGSAILVAPPSSRMNALVVAAEIARHGVTIMSTVPSMLRQFNQLSQRIDQSAFATLRYVMCTGSALTPEVARTFMADHGIEVLNYYGLTETAGLCVGVLPGNGSTQCGTIGVPIGAIAAIVGSNGTITEDGAVGRLLIWSENLMTRYYRNGNGDSVLSDGWLQTGDLACRRQDGSITLVDRESDAVKDSRGELIHPREIEEALERHEFVAEAGVCGYRDPDGDERLAAFVVPAGAADGEELCHLLRCFILNRLGAHRVPSLLHAVTHLPRGTNGKLLRRKLMELIPS